MDPRIKELKTTAFSGRRLSRRHLGWKSAKGSYKVGTCMGMPGVWIGTAS